MKTRLEQLTVSELVELLSGNHEVLAGKHEMMTEEKSASVIRSIIYEYREIADPAGAKSFLTQTEEQTRTRYEVLLYTMCGNLLTLRRFEDVREILEIAGINASRMNESRLKAEVETRTSRANRKLKEYQEENPDDMKADDIRKMFDTQTAYLMTHFKFQIDTETMKASVYAHLVARYNAEIKARLNAMNRK